MDVKDVMVDVLMKAASSTSSTASFEDVLKNLLYGTHISSEIELQAIYVLAYLLFFNYDAATSPISAAMYICVILSSNKEWRAESEILHISSLCARKMWQIITKADIKSRKMQLRHDFSQRASYIQPYTKVETFLVIAELCSDHIGFGNLVNNINDRIATSDQSKHIVSRIMELSSYQMHSQTMSPRDVILYCSHFNTALTQYEQVPIRYGPISSFVRHRALGTNGDMVVTFRAKIRTRHAISICVHVADIVEKCRAFPLLFWANSDRALMETHSRFVDSISEVAPKEHCIPFAMTSLMRDVIVKCDHPESTVQRCIMLIYSAIIYGITKILEHDVNEYNRVKAKLREVDSVVDPIRYDASAAQTGRIELTDADKFTMLLFCKGFDQRRFFSILYNMLDDQLCIRNALLMGEFLRDVGISSTIDTPAESASMRDIISWLNSHQLHGEKPPIFAQSP